MRCRAALCAARKKTASSNLLCGKLNALARPETETLSQKSTAIGRVFLIYFPIFVESAGICKIQSYHYKTE